MKDCEERDICTEERFADIQLLRYHLDGFDQLTLQQKKYIYYLSEATLWGRDITFDQFGKYNLQIRKVLETIYVNYRGDRDSHDFKALEIYLKRIWFSNGIYHHYGCEKFVPDFSENFLRNAIDEVSSFLLPLGEYATAESLCKELMPVIFDCEVLPKRVNKSHGVDIVRESACNYYEDVSQQEAEKFYSDKKIAYKELLKTEESEDNVEMPSFGLNSKLVKENGILTEKVWSASATYGATIKKIVYWLKKAKDVAENSKQQEVINLLINYYETGDLKTFDDYSIAWIESVDGMVDFINGFIEVYGDPLGIKGSWEGIVEYKNLKATERTRLISDNAQWFEDHSPVDPKFKKNVVKGVVANVICAAMLGGDEYPSSAIGINLPNANWIRSRYGSKSVTIGNLTDAYKVAAKNSGMRQEFVIDKETIELIDKYGDLCDELHTDLHECVGHGSGQLLPGVDDDALKNYGNTIEEARADLFGLYYVADDKLVELGLVPDREAYKSQYYSYILNGLMTQLVRITPGNNIEEAHMRNRALIAHWCYEHGKERNVIEFVKREGKTYVRINDYSLLRDLFAELLAEIQRIKSEGDYDAAHNIVEKYAVKIDSDIHREVLDRYKKLNLAPYKGFINPIIKPLFDKDGNISDVSVEYGENYAEQMLRYSRDYSVEI